MARARRSRVSSGSRSPRNMDKATAAHAELEQRIFQIQKEAAERMGEGAGRGR
jgi:hypothetical protein